jgi:hypothetical protein
MFVIYTWKSSDKCEINGHKRNQNVNKEEFWLPYRILLHYTCTNCQKQQMKKKFPVIDQWLILLVLQKYSKFKKLLRNKNYDLSWNPFYCHSHCTCALACTEASVPCESEGNTGELSDSLPRNDAVFELCSGEYNVAYCRYPEWKLPIPTQRVTLLV